MTEITPSLEIVIEKNPWSGTKLANYANLRAKYGLDEVNDQANKVAYAYAKEHNDLVDQLEAEGKDTYIGSFAFLGYKKKFRDLVAVQIEKLKLINQVLQDVMIARYIEEQEWLLKNVPYTADQFRPRLNYLIHAEDMLGEEIFKTWEDRDASNRAYFDRAEAEAKEKSDQRSFQSSEDDETPPPPSEDDETPPPEDDDDETPPPPPEDDETPPPAEDDETPPPEDDDVPPPPEDDDEIPPPPEDEY